MILYDDVWSTIFNPMPDIGPISPHEREGWGGESM